MIKAFHPRTMGVMYVCTIIRDHGDGTSTVRFFDGCYHIPNCHISINGVLGKEQSK